MASETITVTVANRTETGKNANRRLRRNGSIPCVLYGKNIDSRSLTATAKDIRVAIDHPAVITLAFSGNKETASAVVKNVQHDFLSASILHVDFQQVNRNEKITSSVPLELIGDPVGTHHGGTLDQLFHTLEIECFPQDIPEYIRCDVSKLDLGDSITLAELDVPEGVVIVSGNPDTTVAHVLTPRAAEEDEEAEDEAEPEVIAKAKKTDDE